MAHFFAAAWSANPGTSAHAAAATALQCPRRGSGSAGRGWSFVKGGGLGVWVWVPFSFEGSELGVFTSASRMSLARDLAVCAVRVAVRTLLLWQLVCPRCQLVCVI